MPHIFLGLGAPPFGTTPFGAPKCLFFVFFHLVVLIFFLRKKAKRLKHQFWLKLVWLKIGQLRMAKVSLAKVGISIDDSPAGSVDRCLSSHSLHFPVSSTGCVALALLSATLRLNGSAHAQPELKQSARSSSSEGRILQSPSGTGDWCVCVLGCRSIDLAGRLVVHWTSH